MYTVFIELEVIGELSMSSWSCEYEVKKQREQEMAKLWDSNSRILVIIFFVFARKPKSCSSYTKVNFSRWMNEYLGKERLIILEIGQDFGEKELRLNSGSCKLLTLWPWASLLTNHSEP